MNKVIDYKLTNVGYTEPVTVEEAKSYARILTGTSEDALIAMLITASRQAIEAFSGLSLIPKTAKVVMSLDQPLFELPYGPVTATPVFKDDEGNLQTVYLVGYDFPKVKNEYTQGLLTAEYDCGYGECPHDIKIAILDQFTFNYQNRGDNQDSATVCLKAQKSLMKYNRHPFFL